MKCFYLTLFLVLYFWGCADSAPKMSEKLKLASEIIMTSPDSTLNILLNINEDDLTKRKDRADYYLLLTIAHDKTYIKHTSVSEILYTSKYYKNRAQDSLHSVIYCYMGKVYLDMDDEEEALKSFLKAKNYSRKVKNSKLRGQIHYYLGYLYHKDKDYEYAQFFLDSSIKDFEECHDTLNEALAYDLSGRNLALSGKYERALAANKHSGQLYAMLKDSARLISNAAAIANICLYDLNDPVLAERTLKTVYKLYNNDTVRLQDYPLIGSIYAEQGKFTEAIGILNDYLILSPKETPQIKSGIYYMLSLYSYEISDFKIAYDYIHDHILILDSLYEVDKASILQVAEKKYEKQELENEYSVYRQRTIYNVVIIGLISIILIFSLIYTLVRRKRKIKNLEADLDGLRSQMGDFVDLRIKLSNILDKANVKEIRLQEVLNNKILQLQKIVNHLFIYDNDPEEFKKKIRVAIVQAEKDQYFGELHETVNEKYYGIVDYLRSEFSTLSEDEINMCCLICFGFNNNEISILFGHTNSNSIFNKRHKLRKKLGLWPHYESLEDYLSVMISELKKKKEETIS